MFAILATSLATPRLSLPNDVLFGSKFAPLFCFWSRHGGEERVETEGTCEEWPMHACVLMERGGAAWVGKHAWQGYSSPGFFLHSVEWAALVCESKTMRILF